MCKGSTYIFFSRVFNEVFCEDNDFQRVSYMKYTRNFHLNNCMMWYPVFLVAKGLPNHLHRLLTEIDKQYTRQMYLRTSTFKLP